MSQPEEAFREDHAHEQMVTALVGMSPNAEEARRRERAATGEAT